MFISYILITNLAFVVLNTVDVVVVVASNDTSTVYLSGSEGRHFLDSRVTIGDVAMTVATGRHENEQGWQERLTLLVVVLGVLTSFFKGWK